MTAKKRGPKPKADRDKSAAVFSTRMPKELRKRLEAAARANGRKLSPEIISRLEKSFPDRPRDPALRALGFLIEETARAVGGIYYSDGRPSLNWRTNPFLYHAFTLALTWLLDAMKPKGEIHPPQINKDGMPEWVVETFQAPELRARSAIMIVWDNLVDNFKSFGSPELVERQKYGFQDAKRDLRIGEVTDVRPLPVPFLKPGEIKP